MDPTDPPKRERSQFEGRADAPCGIHRVAKISYQAGNIDCERWHMICSGDKHFDVPKLSSIGEYSVHGDLMQVPDQRGCEVQVGVNQASDLVILE